MSESIPGRRISHGDTLYTDWTQRRGDSLLLRAECIVDSGGSVDLELQTRSEPGPGASSTPSEVFTLTPTVMTAGTGAKLQMDAAGVFTALYLAAADGTGASMRASVRLKITFSGSPGQYQVVRVLPFNFFDNAKP